MATTNFYLIAAQPGWFVGQFCAAENSSEHPIFFYEEIIAWRFHEGVYHESKEPFIHSPYPLTITGDWDNRSDWLIKTPNGTFEIQADASFKTEQDALNYFQKDYEERKQKRA
jgi:hypothetical protein